MAGGVVVNVNDDHHFDDAPTEGTKTYAIIVCLFASLGGLFFGY
ncbi:Major facilitator superfamily, partial [Globisporangium polare]